MKSIKFYFVVGHFNGAVLVDWVKLGHVVSIRLFEAVGYSDLLEFKILNNLNLSKVFLKLNFLIKPLKVFKRPFIIIFLLRPNLFSHLIRTPMIQKHFLFNSFRISSHSTNRFKQLIRLVSCSSFSIDFLFLLNLG